MKKITQEEFNAVKADENGVNEIQQQKNKKVKEPNVRDVWECSRCYQGYCGDCVEAIEVDFDNQAEVDWCGTKVCPWCYNQLIDKDVSLLT